MLNPQLVGSNISTRIFWVEYYRFLDNFLTLTSKWCWKALNFRWYCIAGRNQNIKIVSLNPVLFSYLKEGRPSDHVLTVTWLNSPSSRRARLLPRSLDDRLLLLGSFLIWDTFLFIQFLQLQRGNQIKEINFRWIIMQESYI